MKLRLTGKIHGKDTSITLAGDHTAEKLIDMLVGTLSTAHIEEADGPFEALRDGVVDGPLHATSSALDLIPVGANVSCEEFGSTPVSIEQPGVDGSAAATETDRVLQSLRGWSGTFEKVKALYEKMDRSDAETQAMALRAEELMAPWYNYRDRAKQENLGFGSGPIRKSGADFRAFYQYDVVKNCGEAPGKKLSRAQHAAIIETARAEVQLLGEILRQFGGSPWGDSVLRDLGTLPDPGAAPQPSS